MEHMTASHDAPPHPGAHGDHETNSTSHDDHAGHDKHAGHSPEMFRDRLLVSLLLTIPILYFSPQIRSGSGTKRSTSPAANG